MSERYIKTHFDNIKRYASVIEKRLDDTDFTLDVALEDNKYVLEQAKKYNANCILIDEKYEVEIF